MNDYLIGELMIAGVQAIFVIALLNTLLKDSYVPRGTSFLSAFGLFIIAVGFMFQAQWLAFGTSILNVLCWSGIFVWRGKK